MVLHKLRALSDAGRATAGLWLLRQPSYLALPRDRHYRVLMEATRLGDRVSDAVLFALTVCYSGVAAGVSDSIVSKVSNVLEEFWNGNLQRLRNSLYVHERYISFAPFNPSDIGAIQTADVGKLFLGYT